MSSSESKQFEQAKTLDELEALRVALLGRKSELNTEFAKLTTLPIDQRSQAGKLLNQRRGELESAYNEALKRLQQQARQAELDANPIDISSPVASGYGHGHPVLQVVDEFLDIFTAMGYEIADGPEVEDEWHNFEALNIPGDHPARDMQDTFYLEGGNVPRTHTSNMQIRYMENHQPPIRIVSPGKVYRNEDEDARHAWMFHQVEGLVVDKGISLGDLKGTLLTMIQGIVGDEIEIRLRPNYFPYTEPSVEADGTCIICNGKGCATCSHTGWLELGGAGMVHPQVLRNVGIDPEVYSGFAFGFGPERLAILRYGVPDIREFWRPRMKFLEQF